MTQPSTAWREQIAADEADRHAQYARDFAELQRSRSAKYGNGRAVHRKQVLALPARLEVFDSVPEYARQGLFARPGLYEARIRLSNGAPERSSDRRPDVRGFAFKVLGIHGPGALGNPTASQDFALINQEVFGFPTSAEFVGLVMAATHGPLRLVSYLHRRYGLFGALKLGARLAKNMSKTFKGFDREPFYSAAPIMCGPYAARVRLRPLTPDTHAPAHHGDLGAAMLDRLDKSGLDYQLELQFFVDEQRTPIEDASVNWEEKDAPYVPVGRLRIPPRSEWAAQADAITAEAEMGVFDPWCALAEHRPLGEVMRARKVTYFESQKQRGAA